MVDVGVAELAVGLEVEVLFEQQGDLILPHFRQASGSSDEGES